MKKTIALILALIFAFTLAACGSDEPASEEQNPSESAPAADVPAPSGEESVSNSEPASDGNETEAPSSGEAATEPTTEPVTEAVTQDPETLKKTVESRAFRETVGELGTFDLKTGVEGNTVVLTYTSPDLDDEDLKAFVESIFDSDIEQVRQDMEKWKANLKAAVPGADIRVVFVSMSGNTVAEETF
ncbi:MAG: hypothetical protein IK104_01025 [Clostridia bacterium]|nr:hypothetical protein [Clostridia bacterium]